MTIPEGGGLTYFLPQRLAEIRVNVTKAETATLKAEVDAANSALAAATTNLAAANAQKTNIEANLALPLTGSGAADARAQLEKELTLAKAAEARAMTAKAAAETKLSEAQSRLATASASTDGCLYAASMKLLPPTGDPNFRFVARDVHNWTRDDETTLKVDEQGLLTSSKSIAADRTSDILVELAGFSAARELSVSELGGSGTRTCDDTRPFFAIVDLSSSDALEALNNSLIDQHIPLHVQRSETASASLREEVGNTEDIQFTDGNTHKNGLFYRTPLPLSFDIRQTGSDIRADRTIAVWSVSLPQAGPVGFVPMTSSAFVTTTSTAEFSNGTLTSIERDRPSEVLAVAKAPVEILKAVFSIPTSLLKLSVDYSSAEASQSAQLKSALESEIELQLLQACLEAAGTDTQALAACKPSDAE